MNLQIPPDKLGHFTGGLILGMAAESLIPRFGFGVVLGLAAGILKEALDWWSNRKARRHGMPATHSVEAMDAVATAIGGALATVFHGLQVLMR